jgi:hypothetical protein
LFLNTLFIRKLIFFLSRRKQNFANPKVHQKDSDIKALLYGGGERCAQGVGGEA